MKVVCHGNGNVQEHLNEFENENTLVYNVILSSKHMVIRCCCYVIKTSQTFSQRPLTMICRLTYERVRNKKYIFLNETKQRFK